MSTTSKFLSVLSLLVILGLFIVLGGYLVPNEPERISPPASFDAFLEIKTPFKHHKSAGNHFIFGTAAVIDIESDGTLEIYVGDGEGYPDMLLDYQGGQLVRHPQSDKVSDQSATYGATATDMDGDGRVDLLVARSDAVTFYRNTTQGFVAKKLAIDIPEDSFILSVSPADYDKDGDTDLYASVFVDVDRFMSATFNDPSHARSNLLLRNEGNMVFSKVSSEIMADSRQNTFTAVWHDLDQDGLLDLVLAQNTDQVTLIQNLGDRFLEHKIPTGYGFWMSATLGDIDNDGDADLFFSNSGNSIPGFLLKGDLKDHQQLNKDWVLLRNDGKFKFKNVIKETGLSGYGFGWGGVFEDVNLDGRLDLLVAENYLKWPFFELEKLPGHAFLNLPDGGAPSFYSTPGLGLNNPYYGQTPIIADLNNDGRQDVLWFNMDGPLRAFLNTSKKPFITLRFLDSAQLVGTRAYLVTSAGRSYTRFLMNNVGQNSDQTADLSFGFGADAAVERIVIIWPDNTRRIIERPDINTRYIIRR